MTAREASQNPEGAEPDAEPELSERERRRKEKQDARREAKRQKEELERIKRQMRQPRPKWIYGLAIVGGVLLLLIAVGGYMFYSSYSINLYRKNFMDNYNVADLAFIRRYAPNRLKRVEELKEAAENKGGTLSVKEVIAQYRDADTALQEARAAARDNETRYRSTLKRFDELYEQAKAKKLDKYAPSLWARVEEARKTATTEAATTFSVQLAIEKLEEAITMLEEASRSFADLQTYDAAVTAFDAAYSEINDQEWARNIPDEYAALKLALKKAQNARDLSKWIDSAQLYREAAKLIPQARAKLVELRDAARNEVESLQDAYQAAEVAGIPKSNPEAWKEITDVRERTLQLMADYDYRGATQTVKEGLELIGKTGEDLLNTKEKLVALLTEVKALYEQAKQHAAFFRANKPEEWTQTERDYLQIPELIRRRDNVQLLKLATQLKASLTQLVADRTEMTEEYEQLKKQLEELDKNPAIPFLEANYPDVGRQLFSLRRSVARFEQRNQFTDALRELRQLTQLLQTTVDAFNTVKQKVEEIRRDVAQRRIRYRKGIDAFRHAQEPLVERLRNQVQGLAERNLYVEALPIAENLSELVPETRFVIVEEQTVIDNQEGVMWVRDGTSAGSFDGRKLDWYSALKQVAVLSFAGFADWRLPTEEELQEIAKLPEDTRNRVFPNTFPAVYWTNVPSVKVEQALAVDMTTARTRRENKAAAHYIRAIRAPE
jgi:hypothetical protein